MGVYRIESYAGRELGYLLGYTDNLDLALEWIERYMTAYDPHTKLDFANLPWLPPGRGKLGYRWAPSSTLGATIRFRAVPMQKKPRGVKKDKFLLDIALVSYNIRLGYMKIYSAESKGEGGYPIIQLTPEVYNYLSSLGHVTEDGQNVRLTESGERKWAWLIANTSGASRGHSQFQGSRDLVHRTLKPSDVPQDVREDWFG